MTEPAFVWQSIERATSYQVQVADLNGHEVLKKSKSLVERDKMVSTQSLKRGSIYTWTVTAIVQGNEIASPASSASEVRFKILDERDLETLQRVQSVSNSHLLLGLFYCQSRFNGRCRERVSRASSRKSSFFVGSQTIPFRSVKALE